MTQQCCKRTGIKNICTCVKSLNHPHEVCSAMADFSHEGVSKYRMYSSQAWPASAAMATNKRGLTDLPMRRGLKWWDPLENASSLARHPYF